MEGQRTKVADKLQSVETKYVNNQMAYDTYNRWHQDLSDQIKALQSQITKHSKNDDDLYSLLNKELYRLTDMRFIYQMASVPLKQQLIRQVFELKLNYSEGVYRTTSLNKYFMYNEVILIEKRLLFVGKKGELIINSPQVDHRGTQLSI